MDRDIDQKIIICNMYITNNYFLCRLRGNLK